MDLGVYWLQDLLLLSQKGGGNVSAELMEVQRKAKANGAVNHYRVLGVQQTALLAEVKAAYRSDCMCCLHLFCLTMVDSLHRMLHMR